MPGEKIRILHVITRLVVGGAQENTLLTTARLDRARYDVALVSGPTAGPEGSLEDQIPGDIVFERIPELVRDPHPRCDARALRRLVALMRRGRYQIVHTHTTKAGMLGRIAARLARVPVVVHTPHGHAFHGYLHGLGQHALVWAERGLARWTDRIICLTEAERNDHLRLRVGVPEQYEVIHSGIDLARFRRPPVADRAAARRALGLPPAGPLVGCVARLVPVKGVQYLLEALPYLRALVPGASVVFVGDGPLRADLERRAAALGLNGAVVFLGLRRDVPEIIPLCDAVALPSLNEGMGRAAVEALAAGKPVVASRVGGLPDVIRDGETGILIPPADPQALARGLARCLATSGPAEPMARRAAQTAEAYGLDTMIAKLDDLYMRLTRRGR